jgi:hypothetical protein
VAGHRVTNLTRKFNKSNRGTQGSLQDVVRIDDECEYRRMEGYERCREENKLKAGAGRSSLVDKVLAEICTAVATHHRLEIRPQEFDGKVLEGQRRRPGGGQKTIS